MTYLEKTLYAYFYNADNAAEIGKAFTEDDQEFCDHAGTGAITALRSARATRFAKDLARHIIKSRPRPKSKKSRIRKFEEND